MFKIVVTTCFMLSLIQLYKVHVTMSNSEWKLAGGKQALNMLNVIY